MVQEMAVLTCQMPLLPMQRLSRLRRFISNSVWNLRAQAQGEDKARAIQSVLCQTKGSLNKAATLQNNLKISYGEMIKRPG